VKNQPTPAIVTQGAARRFPRWALLLFCVAYVLPGFVGREPWKNQDMTALGYMFEMSEGTSSWLAPMLVGHPPEFDALLPYWLGAWAMQAAPAWLPGDFAARIPFIALLVLALLATWYGAYHLARSPRAQPVVFAFGGEARPADYARAMADAALLALIACLGLAQLSHETTPSLAQLSFTAITFYGVAALPYRRMLPAASLTIGLAGLALSGAPAMAMFCAAGGIAVTVLAHPEDAGLRGTKWSWAALIGVTAMLVAALATSLDAWRWRMASFPEPVRDLRNALRLLAWFTWPAWPLALWTVWRWRRQLASRHVLLPLWFAGVAVVATFVTRSSDRSMLLALPALAVLAAFALPTFKRSVSALIDWFTLLFFTGAAVVIWVVWISMQTGVPAKPAANVAKLAPGFEPSFSLLLFVIALAGTAAWAWLVVWRTGRHREAIWKSLVLPAGGAALCWLLMMTLWLPVLNYARSYIPVVQGITRLMDRPGCVQVLGLNRGQLAAFRFHARLDLQPAGPESPCAWLLMPHDLQPALRIAMDERQWQHVGTVRRPADRNDNLMLYRRAG
jgi:4-amino-4-deoxy-L-arabinose transferase-like glycosyltransferase